MQQLLEMGFWTSHILRAYRESGRFTLSFMLRYVFKLLHGIPPDMLKRELDAI